MYGSWEKRVPLDEVGPREVAIAAMATHLHGDEHGAVTPMGFGHCGERWHTESWFTHMATEVYDGGSGGR